MLLIITIVSIFAIALMTWFANRILPFTVCPICAGSFLTWVWLVSAHFLGYQIDLVIPALLMGGSVVGIAYQLEKKYHGVSPDMRMLWKMLFIPAGFVAAYAMLDRWWMTLLFAAAFLAALALWLASSGARAGPHEKAIEDIERDLKECC